MERVYQVWSTGYCSSDTEGRWTAPAYHGACKAPDFKDAVKRIANASNSQKYFDIPSLTFYGCKLYDSFEVACANTGRQDESYTPNEYGYMILNKSQATDE